VAVEEVEAVEHVVLAEILDSCEELTHEEAELAADACGAFPAACTFAAELDAQADLWADVVLLGVFDDELELCPLFDNGDDVATELSGEHHGFDELIIFETVADDGHAIDAWAACGGGETKHGEEFWLAACFEAKVKLDGECGDLFADVALLVDFDGVDAAVTACVLLVDHCVVEGFADFAQAMVDDVVEAKEDGRVDAALAQAHDDFVQVNLPARVFGGHDGHVAFGVDADVALAPIGHAVEVSGVLNCPLSVQEGAARGEGCHGVKRKSLSECLLREAARAKRSEQSDCAAAGSEQWARVWRSELAGDAPRVTSCSRETEGERRPDADAKR
jgi:hypothetical protein